MPIGPRQQLGEFIVDRLLQQQNFQQSLTQQRMQLLQQIIQQIEQRSLQNKLSNRQSRTSLISAAAGGVGSALTAGVAGGLFSGGNTVVSGFSPTGGLVGSGLPGTGLFRGG